jgi:hypothetical protein
MLMARAATTQLSMPAKIPSTIFDTTSYVVKDRACNLAAAWTTKDYNAAGKWLN